MEWMSPYQKASMEKKSYPEEHLRNIDFWTRDTTYQSGTYSFSLFKQKAKEKYDNTLPLIIIISVSLPFLHTHLTSPFLCY